jgi:polyhydroxybutyrate depolymerase
MEVAGAASAGGSGMSGSGGAAVVVAGSGGTVSATASQCAGKAGSKRGKSEQSVMAGGRRRTFVYYAPKALDANKPVPLVIVPHGYTQSGEEMFIITKYPMIADREGFVAIFPDGAAGSVGPWDVGSNVCGNGALVPGSGDDQAFIDEMITFAADDQCIDRDHIFMTGWSMGGYLSNHTGCLRDDIRAIGPHSAGTHDFANCKTRHKPVIMFHFNPDGLIDYSCGLRARDGWIERNGCSVDAPDVKMVKGGKCEYYKDCAPDGQVAFCTFDIPPNHVTDFLAGHAWSGGNVRAYSIAETESAAELGWSFFKHYAW